MFIIFIAHTPGNSWNDWIPARFGFSSGTELFVFCSGCASAGAFGRVFQDRGFRLGSAKVVRRIWQIYWVQICLVCASITFAYMSIPLVGPGAFCVLSLCMNFMRRQSLRLFHCIGFQIILIFCPCI